MAAWICSIIASLAWKLESSALTAAKAASRAELSATALANASGPLGPASANDEQRNDDGNAGHVSDWNRPNDDVTDLRVAKGLYVRAWYPRWTGLTAAGALCFGVLGFGLWFWVFKLMKLVFLPDAIKPPQLLAVTWTSAADITRNFLVIGHPLSGKSTRLALLGLPIIDLRIVLPKWKEGVRELPETVVPADARAAQSGFTRLATLISAGVAHLRGREPNGKVILDHFDYQMDDWQFNVARLEVLEELVYKHKKIVVIASTVEPLYYLADRVASLDRNPKYAASAEAAESSAASRDATPLMMERWARVLSEFVKVELADASKHKLDVPRQFCDHPQLGLLARTIVRECDATAYLRWAGCDLFNELRTRPALAPTEGDVIRALLDRVETYYGMLWSTLTESERLVLYQLANDGWANPRNQDAILQLQRKELVQNGRGFQIMNESFRTFVLSAPHAAEHRQWELRERESSWYSLKIGFWTLLTATVVWLLYAQRDLFQVSIGYVVTVAGALTAVVNVLGSFRGRAARATDASK